MGDPLVCVGRCLECRPRIGRPIRAYPMKTTLERFAEWLAGKDTPETAVVNAELAKPDSSLTMFLRRHGQLVRKRLPLSLPPAIDPLVDLSPDYMQRLRAMCRRELEAPEKNPPTLDASNREVI